jgi:hypothetical protein
MPVSESGAVKLYHVDANGPEGTSVPYPFSEPLVQ